MELRDPACDRRRILEALREHRSASGTLQDSPIDAKTGERVWRERLGGIYSASPVVADGKIYLVSEDGEITVVAAGRSPRVLARNRLDARLLASPAIAGGRLFLRSDDAVYAIGR